MDGKWWYFTLIHGFLFACLYVYSHLLSNLGPTRLKFNIITHDFGIFVKRT